MRINFFMLFKLIINSGFYLTYVCYQFNFDLQTVARYQFLLKNKIFQNKQYEKKLFLARTAF